MTGVCVCMRAVWWFNLVFVIDDDKHEHKRTLSVGKWVFWKLAQTHQVMTDYWSVIALFNE